MPDVVFMSSYLPNNVLASCYEGVSDSLPFDPVEYPVSSFARVVAEVALRAFNAVVVVYSGTCLVVFTLPEFVIMNIDLIMRHSLFSLQILKANWLFIKVIVVGFAAECSALLLSGVPYAIGALSQIQNAIIGITIAGLDDLAELTTSNNISLQLLPDSGARLLNTALCNWRNELNEEVVRHLGRSTDHGEFWKPSPVVISRNCQVGLGLKLRLRTALTRTFAPIADRLEAVPTHLILIQLLPLPLLR